MWFPMLKHSPDFSKTAAQDLAVCRDLIRQGSRSFHAASLLLPQSVRDPSYALYAFCRLSDDAVDSGDTRSDAIEHLRLRLDRAYAGRPMPASVDRAFAGMVTRFAMPKALPEALIDGLAWDTEGRRYQTLSDLKSYGARVAGSVGAMMTVLMGVRETDTLARACDLGVAMQLTNIARDVGEDARNGRIYLPIDWLEEAGIDPERFLSEPSFNPRLAEVVARLLREAERLYDRALEGIAGLPFDCRPAIHAARLIYREIGREVERRGYNSVNARAVVPGRRKAMLLGAAAIASVPAVPQRGAPPLDETAFLVAAVPPLAPPSHHALNQPAWQDIDGRIGRILEIFERLERRDRVGYAADTPQPSAAE